MPLVARMLSAPVVDREPSPGLDPLGACHGDLGVPERQLLERVRECQQVVDAAVGDALAANAQRLQPGQIQYAPV